MCALCAYLFHKMRWENVVADHRPEFSPLVCEVSFLILFFCLFLRAICGGCFVVVYVVVSGRVFGAGSFLLSSFNSFSCLFLLLRQLYLFFNLPLTEGTDVITGPVWLWELLCALCVHGCLLGCECSRVL